MSSELSTGKTIFILAVVVGCFAVLWPKVFYPMLTASVQQSGPTQGLHWRDALNAHHLSQLCFLLEEQQNLQAGSYSRWKEQDCLNFVKKTCGIVISERILEGFRLSKDKTNLTACLRHRFDITVQRVEATAPPPTRTRPYEPQAALHPHARPERPSHLHPESLHPALREKGRTMPQRTIEKQARPGPMPGIRPPMGGGGHMVPPQTKGSGAMGIIMPLYTVGIVIFFVYTIMKVLFKKNCEEDMKAPKLKDFHLDPEYRKYVFAEEYLDSSNASHRDLLRRQEREASKQRRRPDSTSQPDTKIEEPQIGQQSSTRVDSKGKPLGKWYLPEGFLDETSDTDDTERRNSVGGANIEEAITDSVLDRLIEEYVKTNLSDDSNEDSYEQMTPSNLNVSPSLRKRKHNRTPFVYDDIIDDSDLLIMAKQKGLRNSAQSRERKCEDLYGERLQVIVQNLVKELSQEYDLDDENDQKYIFHLLEKKTRELQNEKGEHFDSEFINKFENAKNARTNSIFKDANVENCVNNNVTVTRYRFDDIQELEEPVYESNDDLKVSSTFTNTNDSNEAQFDAKPSSSEGGITIQSSDPEEKVAGGKPECVKKDEQMDQLRRRLEETERAMEKLMSQMGSVTDKLTAAKITEVLSQAQAQARILKAQEAGERTEDGGVALNHKG